MPGLRKAKKYNWKDSNMALFGSDLERQVKKAAALGEPAWKNAGTQPGLQIWRIVKFIVTDWPKEDYGKFFNGDSYIILNTYTEATSADLKYDVHFWIGSESSQDEYGTAAYKTVELDTFLDDKAVQHREVQGYESELFKSYFTKGLVTMEGGADTGFRHVEPTKYKTRLLQVFGKGANLSIREVPLSKKSLNSDDVFILDAGTTVWQYNGNSASPFEKARSMEFLQNIEGERAGHAKGEVIDEHSISEGHEFFKLLEADESGSEEEECEIPDEKKLFCVSDDSGQIKFSEVKSGKIDQSDLGSDDVFLFDSCEQIFVWIGKNASPAEKRNGMTYAHNHCMKTNRPFLPIHVVKEGRNYASLDIALSA
ncbi:gelsolin-like protein 1 [Mercenaria mercenaria]|uniref:gelsolin-like protein 1 n=1 Tax=Mercenaria mercenaria TaxID=6596 RepID=UPI00234EF3B5|nr:gelsolin-like protein 1 [Mercenaria mercenaria]